MLIIFIYAKVARQNTSYLQYFTAHQKTNFCLPCYLARASLFFLFFSDPQPYFTLFHIIGKLTQIAALFKTEITACESYPLLP